MSESDANALKIPTHVGYILDGNRRWAKKHGLPPYEGHLAGYSAMKDILPMMFRAGIEYVSAYTFSSENWKRGQEEISKIMSLMIRLLTADIQIFNDNQIRLIVAGRRDGLAQNIIKAIDNAEAQTKLHQKGTFILCFNYGGQLEIVDAFKAIIRAKISDEAITPALVAQYLYAPEVPPVDVIVRTSGEHRLSNFMLWRAAYSEFIFLEKLWPDMRPEDVHAIIEEYSNRQRRFGN